MNELPEIPAETVDGEKILAPAESYSGSQNFENPELYAVFPYRIYGVGKPELGMACRTFEHRIHKNKNCWAQDGTQAAFLGLTEFAADDVISRVADKHAASRFPAFWGPNSDWIPDQDHGGNMLMTLQAMLMHVEGDEILLFPSWPKEWDVKFKLHAPHDTIIEGSLRGNKVISLNIEPAGREKDIRKMEIE